MICNINHTAALHKWECYVTGSSVFGYLNVVLKMKDTLKLAMRTWHPFQYIQIYSVLRNNSYIWLYTKSLCETIWKILVYLSFLFLVHDHPSMVFVIMVMYITGRNEFKCFVRLFELWFPICASTCRRCVLSHVVALDEHNLQPTCSGVRQNVSSDFWWRWHWLFLLSTLASIVIAGQRFLILWCSIQCVFLMWNNKMKKLFCSGGILL